MSDYNRDLTRSFDRDAYGVLKRFGDIPDGNGGRHVITEQQDLNGKTYARIRVVILNQDGREKEVGRLWFNPGVLPELIASLETLKAAFDLEVRP